MLESLSLVERMKRIIHFKDFSDVALLDVVRAGNIRKYKEDTTIFFEDAECFGLCVLLRGEVHLYKSGLEGQENIIAVIKPTIMFNEVATIDGGNNPATAIANQNSVIWHTNLKTFQYGLKKYPALGIGLLQILAKRNRALISKYADLSFRPVSERVALLLLDLSDNGEKIIDRKEMSIQEMAAHIASDPVVISRTLGELREEGFIESTRLLIDVVRPDKLAEFAFVDLDPAFT